jgi:DNA-directed RNA polymerase subunit M/transcription elongation factor TFIIS
MAMLTRDEKYRVTGWNDKGEVTLAALDRNGVRHTRYALIFRGNSTSYVITYKDPPFTDVIYEIQADDTQDIIVVSEDEGLHCEKCGSKHCSGGVKVGEDSDGPIYGSSCLSCHHRFRFQTEDEFERAITGD